MILLLPLLTADLDIVAAAAAAGTEAELGIETAGEERVEVAAAAAKRVVEEEVVVPIIEVDAVVAVRILELLLFRGKVAVSGALYMTTLSAKRDCLAASSGFCSDCSFST